MPGAEEESGKDKFAGISFALFLRLCTAMGELPANGCTGVEMAVLRVAGSACRNGDYLLW